MAVSRERFSRPRDFPHAASGRLRDVGHGRFEVLACMTAIGTAVAFLVPRAWLAGTVAAITRLSWRWLPLLLGIAGLAGLIRRTSSHWRRTDQRPVAERVPLFLHVAVLLLLALAVGIVAGVVIWIALGRPDLAAAGAPTAAGTTGAWSVQNTFDAVKIVLAVVAGIGGVVALTVAYRKQGHSEAAEHRENTKLFNERFRNAAEQLGSDKAAVRLAGTYAMAGLADDWAEGRQTCIDVLCAYLRKPYTPPPHGTARPEHGTLTDELVRMAMEEQQVRHTIIALIRDHLVPAERDTVARVRWHGHQFDLRGATLDGGSLTGVTVSEGTTLNLSRATFTGDGMDINRAVFCGGKMNLFGATFSDGLVSFRNAEFVAGSVDIAFATLSNGTVSFNLAKFSGGAVDFDRALFSGSRVDFDRTDFSAGYLGFTDAAFASGTVTFTEATFSGGTVDFRKARFSGSSVAFIGAEFSAGAVAFDAATFSGGTLELNRVRSWAAPPAGLSGTEPGVLWPSPEALARLNQS